MADLGTLRPGAGNTTGLPTTGSIIGNPGGSAALSDDADGTFDGQNTNSSGTYQYGRELANTPADFKSMDTVSCQLRYGWQSAPNNSTWDTLSARIMASDGTTVLAAATSGGAFKQIAAPGTTATPTNSSVVGFDYVNTGATKAQWDGALIQVQWVRTRSKGGDSFGCRVYEGWVTGTYTAQQTVSISGSVTPSGALKHKVKKVGTGIAGSVTPSGALTFTPTDTAYTDLVQSLNPVGYWPLDDFGGNFRDASGNGWTATANNGPTYRQTGPTIDSEAQSAASFLASSSENAVVGEGIDDSVTNAMTVSVWFKTGSAAYADLIAKAYTGTDNQKSWEFECNAGSLRVYLFQTDGSTIYLDTDVLGSGALDDDAWHHAVFWLASGELHLDIDGGTYTGSDTTPTGSWKGNTNQGITIASRTTAGDFFDGELAHVAYWDSDIGSANRSALYTGVLSQQQSVAGAVTPTGASTHRISSKVVSGAVTPTGALSQKVYRTFAGAVTPTGAHTGKATRALSGSVTPTGAHLAKPLQLLAGSVTPTGAVAALVAHSAAGSLEPSGSLTHVAAALLGGSCTPTGALAQQAQQLVSGSVTPSGTVSNQTITTQQVAVSGSVTPTGATTASALQLLAGSVDPSGALLHVATSSVAGSVTPTSSVTQVAQLTLAGSITPTGTLDTNVSVLVAGVLAPTGAHAVAVAQLLTGDVTPTGAHIGSVAHALAGSVTPSGVVYRGVPVSLAGAITPSGTVSNQLLQNVVSVSGSVTPTGAHASAVAQVVSGTLEPTGTQLGLVSALLSGAITPTGVVSNVAPADSISASGSVTPMGTHSTGGYIRLAGTIAPSAIVDVHRASFHGGTLAPRGTIYFLDYPFDGRAVARVRALGWGHVSVEQLGWYFARVRWLETWTAGADYQRAFGGVLVPSGALRQALFQLLSGSVTPTSQLSGDQSHAVSGSVTPVGTLTVPETPTQHSVAGAVTPSGARSSAVKTVATGVVPSSGTTVRKPLALEAGSVAPSGALTHKVHALEAGAMVPAGAATLDTPGPTFQHAVSGAAAPAGDFLIFGPARQTDIQQLQFDVDWWNQPATGGRCEYADNPSFIGSYLTNEQVAPLTFHSQKIGNGNPPGAPALQPNTTYYVRQLLTTAGGLSRTTYTQTYQTAIAQVALAGGVVPGGTFSSASGVVKTVSVSGAVTPTGASSHAATPSAGTRYDTYGAGAGGNFPTYPTIGGSTVLLPAEDAAAGQAAVEAFINSQPSGTTIVFDSSGGGTGYGAGTEIVLDWRIRVNNGSGVLKSNVTLWGYNTRIRQTVRNQVSYGSNRILWFEGGGFQNWSILGFDLMGPNVDAGTYACRDGTIDNEEGHAIDIVSFNGVDIKDCYFHALAGDAVFVPGWDITAGVHYAAFGYPQDIEIGYCWVDGTARQTLAIQQSTGVWVHHCILENSALATWNNEDMVYGTQRYLRNVVIEDSVFRRWNWSCAVGVSLDNWALMVVTSSNEIDAVDNFAVRRCLFDHGHAGWGDPDAETVVYGSPQNGGAGNNSTHIMSSTPSYFSLSESQYSTNLEFIDNTLTLAANQQNGYAIRLRNWHGVTITGNDFQGLDSRLIDCSGITWSDNGSSTYVTS